MPLWWSEFLRAEAASRESVKMIAKVEELDPHESVSLSHDSTTYPGYDNSIPLNMMVTPVFPVSRAEPTDNTPTTSSTRSVPEHVFASEISTIECQDRLWEVEKILHKRTARGRGLRVKRAKSYFVQWKPSWLSTEELRYTRTAWNIVETSQDGHLGKGEALRHNKIKVTRAVVEHASTSDAE